MMLSVHEEYIAAVSNQASAYKRDTKRDGRKGGGLQTKVG